MAVDIYYFDGSDAAATDPDAVWTNDSNAFDGSTSTGASTSGVDSGDHGSTSVNFLKAEGTNAPSSGGNIIQVRARMHGSGDDQSGLSEAHAAIYTDNLGELLGTVDSLRGAGSPPDWDSYVTLSEPTGGWTWEKIQALEIKIYNNGYDLNGDYYITRVEIEVTSEEVETYISPFPAFRA